VYVNPTFPNTTKWNKFEATGWFRGDLMARSDPIKFSTTTRERLGHYVYGLVDPRDGQIFYIGVASANNRAFDHLKIRQSGKRESRKEERIREIRKSGHEPQVEILRHGMNSRSDALEMEAALIDALGRETLTNEARGHGIERGRKAAADIERIYGSPPVRVSSIREPCILFFVHRTFSPTSTEQENYDSVRQFWTRVGERTRTPPLKHRVALGVVEGVVVRAYTIEAWFPAGTTYSSRDWHRQKGAKPQWEFVGKPVFDHPLLDRLLVDDEGNRMPAFQQGYYYLPRTSERGRGGLG
jgi:uncharacterized protein